MSEIRKDPILKRWVIIDPDRPVSYASVKEHIIQVSDKKVEAECPFCPGSESRTGKELIRYNYITEKKSDWDLRVVPNRTPILKVEETLSKEAEGIYDWMSGVGAHEIIIESPFHNDLYATMSNNRLEQIFWAYHDRIMDLKNDSRLEYMYFFKDYGKNLNGNIDHPYSSLVATPFIPIHVENEMRGAEEYFNQKDRCVYCDIVRQELKNGNRLVAMNESFVAVCPYASRYPFEFWILPVKHISNFESSLKSDFYHLAEVVSSCFRKMNTVLGNIPFSMALHNSPVKIMGSQFYHWHIEVYPEIFCRSALLSGGGLNINPVLPEEAADKLRNENLD